MKRRAVLAALMLWPLVRPAVAGPTGEPDPALKKLMAAALAEGDGFADKYVAQVWLVDMAGRLQRYAPKAMPDAAARQAFLRQVHAEATRARLSPSLVLAVIDVESGFQRLAVSSAGAMGYMQIMPFWLEELGQQGGNLFHGETNLRLGCTILRYYLDLEHDSYVRALARYNGSTGQPDYPYLVLQRLDRRWSS